MSVQTRNRQPAQPDPAVQTAQVAVKDPWSLPTIEVTFSQLPTSRWTATRSMKWNGLDLESQEAVTEIQTSLDALDEVIRQHIADLYERDSAEREQYFRTKQQQGGGYDNGYR